MLNNYKKNLHNLSVIAIWRITIPINKIFSVGQVVIKLRGHLGRDRMVIW